MPPPSDAERLAHIAQAITWLIEFVGDMDYAGYLQDRKTQLSVERLLEIIGEAASHISPELKARYETLPWRQVIALRNVVSHEYFRLRLEVIWEVANQEIPPLKPQIEQILQDLKA